MSRIRHSLSTKLSLSIMLMAIPIFALTLGYLFFQSRSIIREEAQKRASSVLNTTLLRVSNFMSTVETSTNANVWLMEENFTPDSLEAISRRIVMMNRNVNGCSVCVEPGLFPQCGRYFSIYTTFDGDSIVSVRESNYEYFDKVWYKTPLNSGKACWVDPFYNYSESTLNLTKATAYYSMPIYQGKHRVGVITTDLSFRQLTETIYGVAQPYPHDYFMLLGSDGRYFIHPDTTRLFRKTIFSDTDPNVHSDLILLGHKMISGEQGSTHATIDGQYCHVCYRRVPGTNWSLALVCPDNDILEGYHHLAYIIVILIFVGLLTILLLCRRMVGHTISPLRRLLNMSRQIATGHTDKRIPHTERNDDIGLLQNSFASMQHSLNENNEDIHRASEEIKQHNEELVLATQQTEDMVHKKATFIKNVLQQIRIPLNVIMGYAHVMRDSLDSVQDASKAQTPLPKEDVATIAGMMKQSSVRLNRMVLMLFDISDVKLSEELKLHRDDKVSCNEVVRECISHTLTHFPDLPIRFDSELPDSFRILTNRLYLMRTLRELLYNSAKYSDGQHVSIRVYQTETTVRFIFEDIGPGLAADAQDVIFQPYGKTDDLVNGLGLGLPLAKRHALSLGGNITLDTTYHDGCRFIVEMPK